jgi:enoyl-CoA hydratase/carnithine racemase
MGVLNLDLDGPVAFITLNRPERLNALNRELTRELERAVREVEGDPAVRVLVLGGEGGRAFCAGADLHEIASIASVQPANGGFTVPEPGQMPGFDQIAACTKPVVAAIDGWCVAGGFELALLCDMRLATRSSNFGLPEPRRGMLAGPGLHELSRIVPLGEALKLQLTGGTISAERAYDIGLVQELAEDRLELVRKVNDLVSAILSCSEKAVSAIKHIVRAGRDMSVADAWKMARPFQEAMARSEDAFEGPRAFADKTAPEWARTRPADAS